MQRSHRSMQKMVQKMLILADDLTGAADCSALFADCGLRPIVALAGPGESAVRWTGVRDSDVLAVDADTRCMSPEEAAKAVRQIVHAFEENDSGSDPRLLFKKIDSTLRGNVAAELAAALAARSEHAP